MKVVGYTARQQKLNRMLSEECTKGISRLNGKRTFIRNRKMPLVESLVCTLSKSGVTTEMELHRYAAERGEQAVRVTKQGYLQQRKRLDPNVFRYLNQEYLKEFYQSRPEVQTWKKHLVLAIDGSKVEVPNSLENRNRFGQCGNQHTKDGPARAQISCIYDTMNDFCLDIQIGAISESENEQAKAGLSQLRQVAGEYPLLLLFDQGYPSIEFVDYLERNGYSYLFRLSSNDYKKEQQSMKGADAVVELEHTGPRLQKVGRRHPERLKHCVKRAVRRCEFCAATGPARQILYS